MSRFVPAWSLVAGHRARPPQVTVAGCGGGRPRHPTLISNYDTCRVRGSDYALSPDIQVLVTEWYDELSCLQENCFLFSFLFVFPTLEWRSMHRTAPNERPASVALKSRHFLLQGDF